MLFLYILQNINIFPIQRFIHASYSAELPAHRAGIFVFGCPVVTDLFRCFWIDGAFPLFFPVESSSGIAHGIIQITCMRNLFRNICGMSGNTGSNDALFYVVCLAEPDVPQGLHSTGKLRRKRLQWHRRWQQ